MLSFIAKIWQAVKKFLQQFLSSLDHPGSSESKEVPRPYRPLSDEDYEYLWTQLLEGVAYGWQPGRIQRFFETLGDRGHRDAWLVWLERYEAKILANPPQDRALAKRLVKLGEHTQALPEQSSARRVGQTAARLGKALLLPKTTPSQPIWEYEGSDAVALTAESSSNPQPPASVTETKSESHSESESGLPPAPIEEYVPEAPPEADVPHLAVENAPDPEAWFNRGVQFYEQEAYQQAIQYWEKAIAIEPNYYQAWSNRGLALKNLGAWAEALESYDQALEIEPNYSKAWYNRGIALDVLRRYDDAISSFDRVLAQDGDDFRAWYNRGNSLQQCQRYEEAIASYDEALARQPELEKAWYERGNAYRQLQNPVGAIASYDKAIALTAEDPEIWYSRGQALIEAQKQEEAIASFDRALQLKPDAWHIWLGRSGAVKQSLNPDLLLSSLSPVAQQHPELNQRGEKGEIACLEVGLHYLLPDSHPEGWGKLHWRIGQIQYRQGLQTPHPFELWREATSRYQEALKAVIPATLPLLYLAILQDLIEVQIGLEESELATQLHQRGLQQFRNFLVDPQRSEGQKQQLKAQLASFERLNIPIAIQAGSLTQALEEAAPPLTWTQLQDSLDPTTAIIGWHQSPATLTTFVILPETAEPLVLDRPPNVVVNVVLTPLVRAKIRAYQGDSKKLSSYLLELLRLTGENANSAPISQPIDRCPPDLQRRDRFQDWQQSWEYLSQNNAEWRRKLPELLNQLGNILDIGHILEELRNHSRKMPYHSLKNLILIPTAEMMPLPIMALFNLALAEESELDLTLSYLPQLDLTTTLTAESKPPQALVYGAKTEENALWSGLNRQFPETQVINPENDEDAIASFPTQGDIIHLENTCIESEGLYWGDRCFPWEQLENLTFSTQPAIALDLATYSGPTLQRLEAILLRQGASCILSNSWPVDSMAQTLFWLEFYRQLKTSTSPQKALKQTQTWLQTATDQDLLTWCQSQDNEALSAYIDDFAATPDRLESSQPPYANPYYWAGWRISSRIEEASDRV
ncbi:MAG: CHAT domain-containing protein [Spirulinaceae cyanobacterium]